MILDEIIEHKRSELKRSMTLRTLTEIDREIKTSPPPRDFYGLMSEGESLKIISEVKKGSPSRGTLCHDFDPVKIAASYERNGAFAISVLTDERFFGGNLSYLQNIRKNVDLPLLRKDFTIDPYQIHEARLYGADIILLIASVLELSQITELLDVAHELGMSAIVEVHNREELTEKALKAESRVIGMNNRDLKTFKVDISTTENLIKYVPDNIHVISESGISEPAQVRKLMKLGISTFLIGEAFMNSSDPGDKLGEFIRNVRAEI